MLITFENLPNSSGYLHIDTSFSLGTKAVKGILVIVDKINLFSEDSVVIHHKKKDKTFVYTQVYYKCTN